MFHPRNMPLWLCPLGAVLCIAYLWFGWWTGVPGAILFALGIGYAGTPEH
jgi:hypothetical protein